MLSLDAHFIRALEPFLKDLGLTLDFLLYFLGNLDIFAWRTCIIISSPFSKGSPHEKQNMDIAYLSLSPPWMMLCINLSPKFTLSTSFHIKVLAVHFIISITMSFCYKPIVVSLFFTWTPLLHCPELQIIRTALIDVNPHQWWSQFIKVREKWQCMFRKNNYSTLV